VRYCTGTSEDLIQSATLSNDLWGKIKVGDEIHVDNRPFLAYCYWHRYQAGADSVTLDRLPFGELHQFAIDGRAIYPQRPLFVHGSHNLIEKTADFKGKMILIQNGLDAAAWPNPAFSYQRLVEARLGANASDRFRLWWMAHASHASPSGLSPATPPPVRSTRLVDVQGGVQQAVRDLIDWVENDIEPSPNSGCIYSHDHGLVLAPTAATRHGIQAVVTALANGGVSTVVIAGSEVNFEVLAECPPGAGTIIHVEWDFDGAGTWPFQHDEVDGSQSSVRLQTTWSFDTPGTYIGAVRVTSHRDGDVHAQTRTIKNLGRFRVSVT
jgi:hypothetical protein